MLIEITMPVLGLTMESAVVVEWLKTEGDRVEVDEGLLVVETDKAAIEVPSPATGIVGRLLALPGQEIPVGQVIAWVAESSADLAALPAVPAAVTATAAAITVTAATVAAAVPAPAPAPATAIASAPGPDGRPFASPRARVKAAELGVDLARVAFTGERVIEEDVVRAARQGATAGAAPRVTPLAARLAAELGIDLADLEGAPSVRVRAADLLAAATAAEEAGALGAVPGDGDGGPTLDYTTGQIRTLNRIRRVTAERMTASSQTAPQVTYTNKTDMTRAVALRAELKDEAAARGVKLSYDAMIVRAVATALLEFPEVNARWAEGQGVALSAEAHVGVAVDLGGEGLIVPVIRNAHARGLFNIAAELDRLVTTAREGRLGPDDYKGGTFTITNLGLFGIEAFTPIINLPEAAILGIGAIVPTPVYTEEGLVRRDLAMLSLTADHRIVDGAPAARFLRRVKQLLETPPLLLERGL